jgi:hypothetical protein
MAELSQALAPSHSAGEKSDEHHRQNDPSETSNIKVQSTVGSVTVLATPLNSSLVKKNGSSKIPPPIMSTPIPISYLSVFLFSEILGTSSNLSSCLVKAYVELEAVVELNSKLCVGNLR